MLATISPLISEPAHPAWWNDRGVKSGNPAQNKGLANLGQLKHIANQAHAELESILPSGAGYPVPFSVPAEADQAWYDAQKKILNLGQLKAVAKPVYDRLNEISPNWVKNQLELNGLTLDTDFFKDSNDFYYPWNPTTPVSENYKLATVGQIKLVFALRLRESTDGDTAADLLELAAFGTTSHLITSTQDSDQDGVTDLAEIITQPDASLRDLDGDGISDSADATIFANNALADPDGIGLDAGIFAGLIGRWDFEQANAQGNYSDKTGNGNHARPGNATPLVQGMVSRAFHLEEINLPQTAGNHLDIAAPALTPTFSLSFWMQPEKDDLDGTNPQVLWSYKSTDGNEDLRMVLTTGSRITLMHTEFGVLGYSIVGWDVPRINSGLWRHVCLVSEPSNIPSFPNSIRYRLYVDGVAIPYAAGNFTFPDKQLGAGDMAFGKDITGGETDFPSQVEYNGLIDRVLLHNRSLLPAEALSLYRSDIDGDGLWDITEHRSLMWRDINGNAVREANELFYTANPFYYDEPTADHDADGRISLDEQNDSQHPTNPFHPDSDGDLLPDGWEVDNGLNPNDPADGSPTADTDMDGATNREEYAYGSDPTNGANGDTDGDEVSDADEIAQGSHPNDASDNGQPLPPEQRVSVFLAVGDESGSSSEDYVMNIYRIDPDTGIEERYYTLRSGGHGEYAEETQSFFRKDEAYTFQIDWQSTDRGTSSSGDEEEPDFDYTFRVEPEEGAGAIVVDSYDPATRQFDANDPILGRNDNVTDFRESVEKRRAMLVPVEIVPDYNRDGKIDKEDRGKITDSNPYRFWVNDDNDKATEDRKDDGFDIPATIPNDSDDLVVDGVRDLVDFFPLHVDLRIAKDVFPQTQYKYFLAQNADAIKLHEVPESILDKDADNNGPHAYLKNTVKAQVLKTTSLKQVSSDGIELKGAILNAFFRGDGTVVCEAVRDTASPVWLEIRKNDGTLVAKAGMPLVTSGVEYMYRHINIRPASGGEGGRATDITEPENYPDDMPDLESDKYFALVHGYNVNGEQARGWHAELFKRMWWSGSKARFVGVSWHGEESQGGAGMTSIVAPLIPGSMTPNYHANVINAFQTANDLAASLGGLDGEISIAAHSLGNMVVGLAIQDHGLQVENYFLVDAAVAMEAYNAGEAKQANMANRSWFHYDERLWASEWHQLPWPENDPRKELTWRGRLGDVVSKTNAYNFYSSEEEILNNSTAEHASTFVGAIGDDLLLEHILGGAVLGERTWVLQELLKGKGITGEVLGSIYGGWKFNFRNLAWPVDDSPPAALNDIYAGIYQSLTFPLLEPIFLTRLLEPLETTGLAGQSQELMSKPFFDPFPADKTRAELFAQALPARTNPAGRNSVDIFNTPQENRNFDMVTLKNGWFSTETNENRWLHSDIRDVGYLYTYKVYDKFKELGKLNQ